MGEHAQKSAPAEVEAFAPEGGAGAARASDPAADAQLPVRDLAGALHEVSNALTVVHGWMERARAERHSPGEVERALEIAMNRAAQARDIVRRAIGAEVAADVPRTVADVIADAVLGLDPEARSKGVRVEATVDPRAAAALVANASSVVQILTNLLLNAIAVSARGTTAMIVARPCAEGRGLVFGVADQGPGVPAERRSSLFTAGASTRPGGAGIGLRHAAALARSFGGALSLAPSTAGARFELRWLSGEAPRASIPPEDGDTAARASVAPPRRPTATSLEGTRVLLVEDDEAVIDLLDTALTARGASVVSIRREAELEGALALGPFDAALFDISPIQDDVRGAIATVRRASGALRVVLISGSALRVPLLPDEWVSAWVRKPFEVAEILQAIAPRTD